MMKHWQRVLGVLNGSRILAITRKCKMSLALFYNHYLAHKSEGAGGGGVNDHYDQSVRAAPTLLDMK